MRKFSKGTSGKRHAGRLAAYFRARLLEKRQAALRRLREELDSSGEAAPDVSGDFGDMALTSANRETTFQIGTVESDALARIDHALHRIEEGTYGKCEECGKAIPKARLEILPSASLCVKCQEGLEREGGGSEAGGIEWEESGGSEEAPEFIGERAARPSR